MDSITPSPETIRLIAEVLSARATPVAELAAVIAAVRTGLDALSRPEEVRHVAAPSLPPAPSPLQKPRKVKALRKPREPRPAPQAVPEPAPERAVETAPPVIPEAPHSRLLRRADVLAHEHEHHHEPLFAVPGSANPTMHGVVKWFDGRTSKGALRLAGLSADVPLTAEIMASSGIKRLYKDQEIEATVTQRDGQPRLLHLSLPGRNNPGELAGGSAIPSILGGSRVQKDITVEIRHDLSRQRQARAAAETLLGGKPHRQ